MHELFQERGWPRAKTSSVCQPIHVVESISSGSAVSHWLAPLTDGQMQTLCGGEMLIRVVVGRCDSSCSVRDKIILTHAAVIVAVGFVVTVDRMPAFRAATHDVHLAKICVLKKRTRAAIDLDLTADLESECTLFHQKWQAIDLSRCPSEGSPLAMPLQDQELGMDIAIDFAFTRLWLENDLTNSTDQVLLVDCDTATAH